MAKPMTVIWPYQIGSFLSRGFLFALTCAAAVELAREAGVSHVAMKGRIERLRAIYPKKFPYRKVPRRVALSCHRRLVDEVGRCRCG